MEELVSIIVPVYNTRDFLLCCLDSIIHQTYQNLEIILIDDGSTDGSGGICDQYAASDERIQVIHQKNCGLSAARNKGICQAKGEYLAFVDSDDYIHERYIEILLDSCIKGGCDAGIVKYKKVASDGCFCNVTFPIHVEYVTNIEANLRIYDDAYFIMTITAWGKLFKRKLFQDIRFPVGRIHEDEATTYKLLYNANQVAYIDAELYYYRQNRNGIILSGYSMKNLQYFEAIKERLDFYRKKHEPQLYDLTLNQAYFQIVVHYNKTCVYIEHSKSLQNNLRKKQRQLYFILLRKNEFSLKRKIRYTWALFFPVHYYKYVMLRPLKKKVKD